MCVVPFDEGAVQWDAFVADLGESSFCHLAGWREVMTDVLGHECLYRVAKDQDGNWHGVLPMVRVRSRLFGHYLVSMPFLNYGGPLGIPSAQVRLAESAVVEARHSGAELLELRSRYFAPVNLQLSHRKITVLLDLPATVDRLWQEVLPSSRRRQIRRAQREGIECRFGPDQLEPFYEVFRRNMRDLGTPVLPLALFDRMKRVFGPVVVFGVAYWCNQPLAAGCGFVWRDEFEITWVSSLRQHDDKMANMLLYSAFMEEMIGRRVRVFNFGRCTPGGRTHQFKHQWGGIDTPLPWLQWSPRRVTATPSQQRSAYRLAAVVWRNLPLPLTDRLGPTLARGLP